MRGAKLALIRQPWFIIVICLLGIYTYAVFENTGDVKIRPTTANAAEDSGEVKSPIKKVYLQDEIKSKEVKALKIYGFESMNVTFANGENGKISFRLKGRGRRYLKNGKNFSDWLKVKNDGVQVKIAPAIKGNFNGGIFDYWANGDELDLAIYLPPKHGFEDVEVKSVSGDINVNGLKTETFDVSLVSGNVSLVDGRAKNLKVKTVSGDVDTERFVIEKASIKSVSGDVTMSTLAKRPSYKVKTVSGNLELQLPRDADLKVDFESMTGELLNQFASKDKAKGRVKFSSLSGDAEITKLQ